MGHLEAPRGFFALPWDEKEEKGVWELFFEVQVDSVTRCQEGKTVTVAQLVSGEGWGEGDKLLLRGGLLGIQVYIEVTHAQLKDKLSRRVNEVFAQDGNNFKAVQVGGGRVSLVNSSTLCDGAWHSALIEHHMVKDMMSDDDTEYGNNPNEIVNNNCWSVPLLQLCPNSRKSVVKNIFAFRRG